MKKVYFVRHGETLGNQKNEYQHLDIPLSQNGLSQADRIAERFQGMKIDAIISSPMVRARQTAEKISDKLGIPVRETSPFFQEILRPSIVRGKKKHSPEVEEIMNEIDERRDDPSWHHSDEENYSDLIIRAQGAIDFVMAQTEEHLIVVTHGMILKAILAVCVHGRETTPAQLFHFFKKFHVGNTGVSIFDNYKGSLGVYSWNDETHLG